MVYCETALLFIPFCILCALIETPSVVLEINQTGKI
jgi:hypothetical protein